MKKVLSLAFALIMMGGCAVAQETIQLPQPDMKMLKMTVADAMQQRRSGREYLKEWSFGDPYCREHAGYQGICMQ